MSSGAPPEVCAPFHIHPKDGRPIEIQGRLSVGWDSEPTMVLVHVDGTPHAVVNTVEGPPALADSMEAAALDLGDITVMEPDICAWRNGPVWADCANPPDGPPPPLPAPTVPFNATLRMVWPSNTVSVEVGAPGRIQSTGVTERSRPSAATGMSATTMAGAARGR